MKKLQRENERIRNPFRHRHRYRGEGGAAETSIRDLDLYAHAAVNDSSVRLEAILEGGLLFRVAMLLVLVLMVFLPGLVIY